MKKRVWQATPETREFRAKARKEEWRGSEHTPVGGVRRRDSLAPTRGASAPLTNESPWAWFLQKGRRWASLQDRGPKSLPHCGGNPRAAHNAQA
jgi:hypothetical protein